MRAAVYVRVSMDAQAREDRLSLPEQIDKCREYVTAQGWTEVATLKETGTGAHLDERSRMSELRAMVASGLVDVVVAWHPDRLSRDPDHRAVLRYEFAKAGARYATVHDHYADGTRMGSAMDYLTGLGSAQELDDLRRRTGAGRRRKMHGDPEHGIAPRPIGSQAPDFGLTWADERKPDGRLRKERLVEDPDTIGWVRWLFGQYDAGISLRGLRSRLEALGVKPPASARTGSTVWSPATLRGVLTNEHYLGIGHANTTMTVKGPTGKKRSVLRPRAEWVRLPEGTFPAVVDEALFSRVQDRIRQNKKECPPGNRTPKVALLRRGVGRCGYCGNNLQVNEGNGNLDYRCDPHNRQRHGCPSHTMSVEKLDAAVSDLVDRLLAQPEMLEQKLLGLREADPTALSLPRIRTRIAELEQDRTRLRRRLREDLSERIRSNYEDVLSDVAEEMERAEVELARLLAERRAWELVQERRQGILDFAAQVRAETGALTWQDRRQQLLRLGVTVKLYRADSPWGRWQLSTQWRPAGQPVTVSHQTVQTAADGFQTVSGYDAATGQRFSSWGVAGPRVDDVEFLRNNDRETACRLAREALTAGWASERARLSEEKSINVFGASSAAAPPGGPW